MWLFDFRHYVLYFSCPIFLVREMKTYNYFIFYHTVFDKSLLAMFCHSIVILDVTFEQIVKVVMFHGSYFVA